MWLQPNDIAAVVTPGPLHPQPVIAIIGQFVGSMTGMEGAPIALSVGPV
jgi:hypothetical protein